MCPNYKVLEENIDIYFRKKDIFYDLRLDKNFIDHRKGSDLRSKTMKTSKRFK